MQIGMLGAFDQQGLQRSCRSARTLRTHPAPLGTTMTCPPSGALAMWIRKRSRLAMVLPDQIDPCQIETRVVGSRGRGVACQRAGLKHRRRKGRCHALCRAWSASSGRQPRRRRSRQPPGGQQQSGRTRSGRRDCTHPAMGSVVGDDVRVVRQLHPVLISVRGVQPVDVRLSAVVQLLDDLLPPVFEIELAGLDSEAGATAGGGQAKHRERCA
jgi:hypothetical protein